MEQDDNWRRERVCARCYTQKLKCIRPQDQIACARCTRLHVQCSPRTPKDRCGHNNDYTRSNVAIDTESVGTPASIVRHSKNFRMPPMPHLSTDMLTGPGNGSCDLELSDVNDMCDWQYQTFLPDNFGQNIATNTTSTNMDTVFAADPAFNVDPAIPHNPQAASELPPANVGGPATKAPSLSGWVNDLTKLNQSMYTYNLIENPPVTAVGSQGSIRESSTGRRETEPSSGEPGFEATYRMAEELSALVKVLSIKRGGASHTTPDSRSTQTSWNHRTRKSDELQLEGQVAEMLKDPSNILLLTSTYGRLLGLFNSIIQRLQAQLGPSDIDVILGMLDLANEPTMQSFVIVNMIELLVRRVDRVSKLVTTDVASSGDSEAGSTAGVSIPFPRGLGCVIYVVGEQKAALLTSTNELRAELLLAAD
ncbi:hypothetical protein LTR49_026798 [Elasticomyces elasticus]|nr:hypothetical protein LTR49_026798 [Elasticomyces elasticus]